MHPLLTVTLGSELDVIASRQRARQVAAFCGFSRQDQTRVSTAVSELARDAYHPGGLVQFSVMNEAGQQSLVVIVEYGIHGDKGRNKPRLRHAGTDSVPGIVTTWGFIEHHASVADGKTMRTTLRKPFPPGAAHLDLEALRHAVGELGDLPANVALSDATQQNRVLSDVLATLQAKQVELLRVSRELEETNKTVETLNRLLNEKAEALALANRRKDEFLSTLSHELRGPLSATLMGAQLLQRNPSDPAQTTRLSQLITRQAGHMSRLAEDLLDVSRISRGLVSIDRKPLDMREVIDAAVEQLMPALEKKSHRLDLSIPPDACVLDGDRTRLTQIVCNLLGNAIRYTPEEGHIQVALALHETHMSLAVSDSGIGIAPHLMPHLFDLYVQAERSTDARNGGLGLGLSLVRSLVEIHDGTVSVASAGEGKGSRFTLTLPRAACASN